jgi:hypothetical protein
MVRDQGLGLSPGPVAAQTVPPNAIYIQSKPYSKQGPNVGIVVMRTLLKFLVGGGGHRFESGQPKKNFDNQTKTNTPIPGCHVAVVDWATWHPTIRSNSATCHLLIGPHVRVVLPRQLPYALSLAMSFEPCQMLTSSVPCVTLPVVTCVTFELAQLCTKKSKSS